MQTALVPFYGDEVTTLYDEATQVEYFAPRHVCENIGLSWGGQLITLRNNEILGPELRGVDIYTPGGNQEVTALPLEFLTGWLFGIQAKRIGDESIRAKLIRYQRECYRVLHTYWLNGGVVINPRQKPLDGDLEIINQLTFAIQETREENRATRLIVGRLGHDFADLDEFVSDMDSRVAGLESREQAREREQADAFITEDRSGWMSIYRWAYQFQPDLLFTWKKYPSRVKAFHAVAKSFGAWEPRDCPNSPDDHSRTMHYYPPENLRKAYDVCVIKWKFADQMPKKYHDML